MAAETLSLVDGCKTALYLLDLVTSISMLNEDSCPDVITVTDNKSLFDAVHSTKLTLDRRLRLDISTVREMCEREEVCLHWIETRRHDVLRKKGASSASLAAAFQNGKIQ